MYSDHCLLLNLLPTRIDTNYISAILVPHKNRSNPTGFSLRFYIIIRMGVFVQK